MHYRLKRHNPDSVIIENRAFTQLGARCAVRNMSKFG
jgi:hypothetical protein